MKQKGAILWLAVLGILFAGVAFGGYKVYQKIQARKMMQWEAKMALSIPEELPVERLEVLASEMNERMDREEVMAPVIEELSLVAAWKVPDAAAAQAKLKEATDIRVEEGKIIFAVRDRDKELVGKLQQSLGLAYDRQVKAEREANGFSTDVP